MPMELGMFLGAKEFGTAKQKQKKCLVLDKEKYRYQKFLSDLAGYDISAHHNKPKKIIEAIRKWLIHYSDAIIPGESAIHERYNDFKLTLPQLCKDNKLKPQEITYFDYVNFAAVWIEEKPFK